jgi:hypothetical protein
MKQSVELDDIGYVPTLEEHLYNHASREYKDLVSRDDEYRLFAAHAGFYGSLLTLLTQNGATTLVSHGATPGQLDVIHTLAEYRGTEESNFSLLARSVRDNIPSGIVFNSVRNQHVLDIYHCETRVTSPYPESGAFARTDDGSMDLHSESIEIGRADKVLVSNMVQFLVLPRIPTSPEDILQTKSLPPSALQTYQVFQKGELIVEKLMHKDKKGPYSESWPYHYIGVFQQSDTEALFHIWCCVSDSTRRPEGNNPEDKRVKDGVRERNFGSI